MPTVERGGSQLHYEVDDGPHDRPAIVFVQPAGLARWAWRWQREALRGTHRIVAPDTRGTGHSAAGLPPLLGRLPGRLRRPLLGRLGHTLATLVADLEAVLADAGVPRAHLVGGGLGGAVALAHASQHGRARSVTVCGVGCDPVDPLEDGLGEPFRARNPHLVDRIGVWQAADAPAGGALDALTRAGRGWDLESALDAARAPVQVIHGSDDPTVPIETVRDACRETEAALEAVPDATRLPQIETPETVTDTLETFLADLEAEQQTV